ncbi:MAG TPA: hypothetical protein VES67_01580 [Vicinamibacterales bacterium]|nr:hypothetical protein [Vicinamibacterales bacterium]
MVERGEHLRFTPKPRQPVRIGDEGVGQNLQRDVAIELGAAAPAYGPLIERPASIRRLSPETSNEVGPGTTRRFQRSGKVAGSWRRPNPALN